ncbi:molybdate ABC transporter substrate-binding protein [Vibrio sp. V27_P1S3P104]|uniref:molybdate ABC transporter substrate-binding protein n=1 Tax=Vibrio TaxID=662 RepID=UPI000C168836|nr:MULTISPECIES: molybdate ABC transporter substrate-binding protein [Vibrio]NAW69085.1 molybdate ABC transporter substrate-binding protein [Vibrio sp. V28_P6S34P95]NAX06326.1 molybdate ABC transporter substrate-binding protein [Vibrio sp. V30_P3S12P165]NAX33483.1 molybdate ABC transporter substrate-binding protein [Vibrio sp. V29_P1S30P107]NAX38673.1 molybdate ABC transporter substrate-binding protein [Vibrio sp. V27_P1S3P104]
MKKRIYMLIALLLSPMVWAQETVHIYAASSMTNAVNDLIRLYQSHHDTKVVAVFGGSSSLARQIEHGAPADVFLSANDDWMTYLIGKNKVQEAQVALLASNQVVLIQPANLNLTAFDVADSQQWTQRLTGERLAVGNTDAVPIGIYSKQVLTTLGVWDTVRSRLAQTNNVRLALALVERGEAPLGMVYKTDALTSNKVAIVLEFDSALHSPIHYPVAQLNNKPSSASFMTFLTSSDAKGILTSYGFNTDIAHEQFAQ